METALRYEQVADRLREQIRVGSLGPGERVPSVRHMSRREGVSIATVVQAYEQLEAQGVLEARPQSGFYVRPPAAPVTARTRAPSPRPRPIANNLLDQVFDIYAREQVLPLHMAAPDPALLPVRRLAALTRDVLKSAAFQRAGYLHPAGLPELRRQVARRLALAGAMVDPDDVVITAGALEALSLSLAVLTQPGDVVLVETPTYYGLLQALKARGLKVVEVPSLMPDGIDVECARKVLREQTVKAAVLTPNYNNPNGALWPQAARQALLAACAAAGVPIIEDDVYADLGFAGPRPGTLFARESAAEVILCGSISKTISPGLRIGWAVAPRRRDALVRAKAFHSCGAPALNQFVAAAFLASVARDRALRRLREAIAANMHRSVAAIHRHFPDGTRIVPPRGGLALWLELPAGRDARSLFEAGVAAGIGSLPGTLFSASCRWRSHLRLSCGIPWSPVVEQAFVRLGQLAGAV